MDAASLARFPLVQKVIHDAQLSAGRPVRATKGPTPFVPAAAQRRYRGTVTAALVKLLKLCADLPESDWDMDGVSTILTAMPPTSVAMAEVRVRR